jgi:membrane protease YdiL (CAAX protease family)
MPVELDSAAILAGCITLGILGGSAVLWIMHLQQSSRTFIRDENVYPWPIGWINFGIFLCAMIACVVVVQVFAGELIGAMSPSDSPLSTDEFEVIKIEDSIDLVDSESAPAVDQPELTPWMAVLAVLLLQLPLLATFYGLRRFYPSSFAGRLNSQAITVWQALAQALPQFIRYLPVIWIASFAWTGLLTVLQRRGMIDEFPPQELIKLFTAGGDPIAITLLVVFAVLLAPIVEELIFRGGIYRFLKSQTTLLPAQILSGAFFAVMHGNLMSFLPLVVVGICLARVYERSGNILAPMCFHACFNGFSLLMLLIMSHSSISIE